MTAMQFFFLSIIQTLVTIEHAIPVSDFLSDILKDFPLSIKRQFRCNLLKVNPFFLLQKYKHQLPSDPTTPTHPQR